MFKHIFGQAIFQLIVILTLVFTAEQYIPEYADKLDNTTFMGIP